MAIFIRGPLGLLITSGLLLLVSFLLIMAHSTPTSAVHIPLDHLLSYNSTPCTVKKVLMRELSAFFLDLYSLSPCAEDITRNNSCPGADNPWEISPTASQQGYLKEMCTKLTDYTRCLRSTICEDCRTQGPKAAAVAYYCRSKATPAVLAACEVVLDYAPLDHGVIHSSINFFLSLLLLASFGVLYYVHRRAFV